MYGCFDAYVVYGIMEEDRYMVLDQEWLDDNFPSLSIYASDVVRNTMGNAVYGILGDMTIKGEVYVCDDDKKQVEELHKILCTYWESEGGTAPSIGYFLVVSGDYEKDHAEYMPN